MSATTTKGQWALFSEDRRYRYSLFRDFTDAPWPCRLNVIGLNPSTADETVDDPTVRRCIGFARDLGFTGLVVTNIFAWRATNPHMLYRLEDPIGPDNDHWLLTEASQASQVIAAWGAHGKLGSRAGCVTRMLLDAGIRLHCLGRTAEGYPRHPLYLVRTTLPETLVRP